ncbi:Gfo/Idh/MocA family oxidoreductase [Phytoactinopolyspora halotolerans]|uniref:Inositol 2-dehydrogenase n=1 Tax=Phytoactinopolyspora halotolerans TaxID=1981512 RepID=A0A6L9SG87_9ACTN|nr:Gfo/Idh/MocA family oxidoreductase [Phytoactinopolyspora halotolerans]
MLRVGVIGTGMIGEDHVRRLTSTLSGCRVSAVTDVDAERARAVADVAPGARVHDSGEDLVRDGEVDAVVVASWGATHEQYVLACLAAGKPVFCEKPLAPSAKECLRIVEAEAAIGRRMVQVGFMRRYDTAFAQLKRAVDAGTIGAPLLVHCAHRNASVPGHFVADMAITDSAVHEFDIVRWLLDDEIVAVRVLKPRANGHGRDVQDPLLILLETAGGVLIDVETSVNIQYGYDIRAEVVGESGTVELPQAGNVVVRQSGGVTALIAMDWRDRFRQAYDVELQAWVDAAAKGGATGPTSWDGYVATTISEAAVWSMGTGSRVPIKLEDRPVLYAVS